MKVAVLLAAVAAVLPLPALAQHEGHAGHAKPAAEDAQGSEPGAVIDHSGHGAPADPQSAAEDPHAAHAPAPEPEIDPHAGHQTGSLAVPPVNGPPSEAAIGPEHAADAYFGEAAMAQARCEMTRMHGAVPAYRILIDRLETRFSDGPDAYALDAQAWYGGDIDKIWLKAEGEGIFGGDLEGVELQALWSHAIGPWFDLQSGIRYDLHEGRADRAHLVLGVQGLAPYWIEIDAAAFLSDRGDLTAKVEVEHDARITQKLILQPRAEFAFSAQDIPIEATGAGLVSASIGARLRYHVTRLAAPYLGLEYNRAFGETRNLLRAAGENLGGLAFVAGLRTWF
jgi:copper resistance protein B